MSRPSPLQVLLRRPSFWFFIVGSLALGAFAVALGRQHRTVELPILASVPSFSLTSQEGKTVTPESLKGQVWVANFIFTRCPTICPTFTAKMAQVQQQSADDLSALKLVSISVDPKYDTPERLHDYAVKFKADASRWSFLTGDEAVIRAVSEGVMQPLDRGPDEDLASLVHGSYFLLIDGDAKVRGFYKFNEPGAVESVIRDAKQLIER